MESGSRCRRAQRWPVRCIQRRFTHGRRGVCQSRRLHFVGQFGHGKTSLPSHVRGSGVARTTQKRWQAADQSGRNSTASISRSRVQEPVPGHETADTAADVLIVRNNQRRSLPLLDWHGRRRQPRASSPVDSARNKPEAHYPAHCEVILEESILRPALHRETRGQTIAARPCRGRRRSLRGFASGALFQGVCLRSREAASPADPTLREHALSLARAGAV